MDPFHIPDPNTLIVDITRLADSSTASFICIYNPPRTNNTAVKALCLSLESIPNAAIIQGDFNLHANEWDPTIIDMPEIANDLLNITALTDMSLVNMDGKAMWHHPSGHQSSTFYSVTTPSFHIITRIF
jgi:hypothetical protein